uniref:MADS2m n=1 Tax=Volvox carteri f. nagariensis TaxID=3068 RepID=D9CJA0_VOLCA|nr:MADS2m [Volvox carteri f. nagariensis]
MQVVPAVCDCFSKAQFFVFILLLRLQIQISRSAQLLTEHITQDSSQSIAHVRLAELNGFHCSSFDQQPQEEMDDAEGSETEDESEGAKGKIAFKNKGKSRRKASEKPEGSDQKRQAFSKRKRGLILKSYQLYKLTDARIMPHPHTDADDRRIDDRPHVIRANLAPGGEGGGAGAGAATAPGGSGNAPNTGGGGGAAPPTVSGGGGSGGGGGGGRNPQPVNSSPQQQLSDMPPPPGMTAARRAAAVAAAAAAAAAQGGDGGLSPPLCAPASTHPGADPGAGVDNMWEAHPGGRGGLSRGGPGNSNNNNIKLKYMAGGRGACEGPGGAPLRGYDYRHMAATWPTVYGTDRDLTGGTLVLAHVLGLPPHTSHPHAPHHLEHPMMEGPLDDNDIVMCDAGPPPGTTSGRGGGGGCGGFLAMVPDSIITPSGHKLAAAVGIALPAGRGGAEECDPRDLRGGGPRGGGGGGFGGISMDRTHLGLSAAAAAALAGLQPTLHKQSRQTADSEPKA